MVLIQTAAEPTGFALSPLIVMPTTPIVPRSGQLAGYFKPRLAACHALAGAATDLVVYQSWGERIDTETGDGICRRSDAGYGRVW